MSQILHGACILVGNQSKQNFNSCATQALHSNVGRLRNLGSGGICPRLQGVARSIATSHTSLWRLSKYCTPEIPVESKYS